MNIVPINKGADDHGEGTIDKSGFQISALPASVNKTVEPGVDIQEELANSYSDDWVRPHPEVLPVSHLVFQRVRWRQPRRRSRLPVWRAWSQPTKERRRRKRI